MNYKLKKKNLSLRIAFKNFENHFPKSDRLELFL